jgi:hypothetical protein
VSRLQQWCTKVMSRLQQWCRQVID